MTTSTLMTNAGYAAVSGGLLVGGLAAFANRQFLPRRTAVAFLAFVGVFLARSGLVGWGYVSDPGIVRLLDLAVGVSVLLVAVAARDLLGAADASPEQRLALVAGLVALPVGAVALAQVAGQAAPPVAASAGACDGAAVARSGYTALTGDLGLNVRAGPGTTYEPQGRFGAGCAVGADGYCVGEAVTSVGIPLPDVRWLRLRHTDEYVSAGTLFALGPSSGLGEEPEDDCPGDQPAPVLDSDPVASPLSSTVLLFEVKPVGTTLVGFGLSYDGSSPEKVEALGISPKIVGADGLALARLILPQVRMAAGGARTVTIAAVPCLAPLVPSPDGTRLMSLDLEDGVVTQLDEQAYRGPLGRLRQAGCRADPSSFDDDIKKAAISEPVEPPGG